MKSRTIVVLLLIGATAVFFQCSGMSEEEILARANIIHDKAITLDTHVDIAGAQYATVELDPGIDNPKLQVDLVKMNQGGMDGVFLAAYVGQGERTPEGFKTAYQAAMDKIEAIHRLAEEMYPERCALATSADDVERIAQTGKRSLMIGVENGYPIGKEISNIKRFYDLGVRYITLCHNGHNQICDSCNPREELGDEEIEHNGLSDFGVKVVAEMNRLGIIPDVSHIAPQSFWDLIEVTRSPIIATHSSCRALCDNSRNLDDEQIRALAENGGVIQIAVVSSFVKEESPEHREAMSRLREEIGLPDRREMYRMSEEELAALRPRLEEFERRRAEIEKEIPGVTVKDFVDHIDHAVEVAGIDHVGIGTDFDGGGGVSGFNSHADAPNVTAELVRRGYTEDEIVKIWGGNLLRVMRETERNARELQSGGNNN